MRGNDVYTNTSDDDDKSPQPPLMNWREVPSSAHLPNPTRYPWTHAARTALAKEASAWAPDVGWGWLDIVPHALRPSAQLLAYYVGSIYESGTIDQLSFHDVPDPDGQQLQALVEGGLILLYEVAGFGGGDEDRDSHDDWRR